jgi:hypothetical protein
MSAMLLVYPDEMYVQSIPEDLTRQPCDHLSIVVSNGQDDMPRPKRTGVIFIEAREASAKLGRYVA